MARLYTNENFPLQVVRELRILGHDVLTSLEAGQANRRIPDDEVLGFAASQTRTLLTQNRRDFLRLHNSGVVDHSGMVLYSADPDFVGQAQRIDKSLSLLGEDLSNALVRVNRPPEMIAGGYFEQGGMNVIGLAQPPLDCPSGTILNKPCGILEAELRMDGEILIGLDSSRQLTRVCVSGQPRWD